MKKLLLLVLLFCLLFCFPALAAENPVIECEDEEEVEQYIESYVQSLEREAASSFATYGISESLDVAPLSDSGDFAPSYQITGPISGDRVVAQCGDITPLLTSYKGANATDTSAWPYLTLYNRCEAPLVVRVSGFQYDNTYTGVFRFSISFPRFDQTSQFTLTDATTVFYSFKPIANWFVSSVTATSSNGTNCPVFYTFSAGTTSVYTFYILMDDVYFSPSNGVIDSNYVVVNIESLLPVIACKSLYGTNNAVVPLTQFPTFGCSFPYKLNGYQFTGSLASGQHNFQSDLSESIAVAQASQAAADQDQLLNGYDDSAGNDANSSLESGLASYESEEQQAHDDFNAAMDSYTVPDISDYAAGLTFVSSAVVMWWNGLGMFKAVLLVAFSLIIFNFISRYRGG